MRLLFILTELPYPAHRNGVALINHALLVRAPQDASIDLLIAAEPDEQAEAELRRLAPCVGKVSYVGPATARRFRVGNLLTGAVLGRNVFESQQAVKLLRRSAPDYDAVYLAPLMSFIDFRRVGRLFLNAVDSFAQLNANAYGRSGQIKDWIKAHLYATYERRMFRHSAMTSFVSYVDAHWVRGRNGTLQVVCVPNGVDTNRFRPGGETPKPHSILFTGNFAYNPNAEAVVHIARHILPKVRARQPAATLQIVGSSPPAAVQGIPGVVTTGFIDDIVPHYRKGSVFACALRSGAGIKNKVLEAMACGVPVVTNALGIDGIEGARSGEHYVAAETDDEFADAILGLWSRPKEAARISRAARELMCTRFSWEHAAKLYFGHLRALSLRNGRPQGVHHA